MNLLSAPAQVFIECSPKLNRNAVNGNIWPDKTVKMFIKEFDIVFETVFCKAVFINKLLSAFKSILAFERILCVAAVSAADYGLNLPIFNSALELTKLFQLKIKQRIINPARRFKALQEAILLPFFNPKRQSQNTGVGIIIIIIIIIIRQQDHLFSLDIWYYTSFLQIMQPQKRSIPEITVRFYV